ncbi:urease accessory protein UreD [Pseudomonas aeruginosa]|uniref:urease accessory protein UreD n=54 Tax=Pseudomonas aeruginosa TaxID=287 RepID=UPI000650F944|nr:urease accessory protein UreD [Pseudomonas aeruginosa]
MTAALPDLSFHPAWHAQLELAYARAGDATRPVTRRHAGPLRVQKHLYAEGPEVCQHILVHPPGGIAGGDSLAFDVRLGERAWAQLTSPGAAKWYRAACPSRQTLEIHLEPGATLEWLPQESIVFAGAQAELETRIQLRGDARLFYWDMVALGRPASGERFASGHFVAALDIRRDDRLLWHERQRIDGGDRLLDSPIGLAGHPVLATLVASGETSLQWLAPDEWLLIVPGGEEYAVEQRLRQALGEELHYAVVNVSGGQTLLELSGANVRELLMKSTSYDVHPSNFPVGKAVGSIFAKSQCVIRHTGEDTWELVVRRSFADYFWLWLQDASAEYGLQVAA